MPDNWFYYVVLIVLLVIMIVLGFFIGYYYQGNREAMEQEIKDSKEQVRSLESNMELDAITHEKKSKELDDLKTKFTNYVTKLGENGINADVLMKTNEDEKNRSNLRKEILQKFIWWFKKNTTIPLPTKEELELDESGAEEYEKLTK
jgi:hypothetical protein